MKISIIAVGKLKEKYFKQGIDEYLKRLGPYAKVQIVEVADERAPENMSDADMQAVKRKEGERILSHISQDTYVITLEIDGKMLSSEQFAARLDELAIHGKSKIAFVIGGSVGISEAVQKRSDLALSFSKLTFPHQMMRMILLEQVYRAFRIMRGEPYHK
ncbi:23S rRNA (pseudouridine(1915)-N(3))-methyltransferase RlmH [Lentibacillus salinarum]|uniref:Ribosomal RNA large subunit methyltransferase H n=1 Tax=Lentibacillus salinarum TaxID=446820 RepID=A0ABW3ZX87_9BACI